MAKKKRRQLNKFVFLSIVILIGGYVLFTLYEQSKELRHLKSIKEEYEIKISQTEEEINHIKENIDNAHSDQYIERIAREQLKMIGANEIIFIDLGKRER
ncbi:FtsB family cell division protein [Alkaliphilus transvaalensis]|uniref:FtsB family cell division protein n=1 Tax=Alkaliphilus transvaalensis TaxID=114628 RepID=UPI00047AA921|nr:septum formation initiator family protein [Alkaliphilus transvaalensis]